MKSLNNKSKLIQVLEEEFNKFYEENYIEVEGNDELVRNKDGDLVNMTKVKADFIDYIEEIINENI